MRQHFIVLHAIALLAFLPRAEAAPLIQLTASPLSVKSGATSLITWSATSATSCFATNGSLSSFVAMSGSRSTPPLYGNTTIKMTCSGNSGTTSRSVTISVTSSSAATSSLGSTISTTPATVSGATTTGTVSGGGSPAGTSSTASSSTTTTSGATSTTTSTTTSTPATSATSGSTSAGIPADARWASPSGTGNCFEVSPCSLSVALQAGATVVLKDGTYSGIGWNGSSEPIRIPSGTASAPTVVRAQNAGGAVINGLWIGRSTRKDSNIRIEGVRVEGGVQLYNTQRVTLKNVGVHGSLDVGTNDHDQGNTDNLIEDVWVWASGQRIIAINYRADRNVWRRVVVRGDGCGTSACSGSGNPNVGITIYDSADVSFQNVMVIDRVLAGSDSPYSDFACAQHTAGQYLWGRNEWLGIVSINAPDQSLYCEPDNVIPGATSATIRDALLWNGGGLNLARQGRFDVSRVWTKARSDDAFRVAPELAGSGSTVSNVVATGTGRYGLNTSVGASNVNVSGTWSGGAYNQTGCVSNCSTSMPSFAPTAYLVRYGTDGARFGEAGYNASQGASPLPWPNEARIKAEMCASTSRGFCSASSLSSYLSTQLR